ncbi:riboflavin synthase [Saccharopolyspora sp. NFXS83]|uniref:riboflavin synthase n=1 Tax=Saccharopolyspora sp. NFXS83 TaxID=2993560 RepID=UPI00224B773B|nr:riboflavin synthase [Saccharopolyspora sp. NFXS83]MCX2732421.1 riboflavin synthase [Saccharopolyspora sp. NFXS83]
MFTGIVEELGTVVSVEDTGDGVRLAVDGPLVTSDAKRGDSIAVNGVCLTVVESGGGRFTVDVVQETVRRSAIRNVGAGDRVNLERAMALGDRLGGHIVQGHVDGTAVLRGSDGDLTRFELPAELSHYLVEKGSITVDGISLTVVDAGPTEFSVALIPTTRELTTLGVRQPGEEVNIEVDVLAKHLERLAAAQLDQFRAGASGS